MTNEELLAIAKEFEMGPEPILNGKPDWWRPGMDSFYNVSIKNCGHPDGGTPRWGIIKGSSFCLAKTGQWEWTPRNSEKEDDFYERCRYATRDEAIEYYLRWKEAVLKWAVPFFAENKCANYEDCPAELIKF